MKHKFFLIVLCLLSLYACSTNIQKELSLNENCFVIDLDKNNEPSIPLSNYYKSVKTIILETNKDCLLGMVTEFQAFDGFMYVLDMFVSKSLFVFDMDGRFIRKIGNMGGGPGEYIQPWDFTVDMENDVIYLLDYGRRIHKYQFDGTFVQTITPKVENTNIEYIQYYNGKLYMSVKAYNPSSADYSLLEADANNGKILSKSLPVKYNKGWAKQKISNHSFFILRLNDPPLYNQLFMDYIVTIGEDIAPYIELKSKNLVTAKDLDNLPELGSSPERFVRYLIEIPKIWDVHSFVENDDIFLFRYRYRNAYTSAIYHKKTGMVELANYLNNDLIYKQDKRGSIGGFTFSDSEGSFEILLDNQIENLKASIRNNETAPDLDKADEILKLDEDANPIIFFYEFK